MYPANSYSIRQATEPDAATLRRLAVLDGEKPFAAPALIAETDGAAVAAMGPFKARVAGA
jgi:hypothetical protein